jgi:hypothetical protein
MSFLVGELLADCPMSQGPDLLGANLTSVLRMCQEATDQLGSRKEMSYSVLYTALS